MRITVFGEGFDLVAVLGTLALGAIGGAAAFALGAPLPWMSGALFAVAAAALLRAEVAGKSPEFPIKIRLFFIPIIGVAIGGTFTPDLLREALGWWPTLLALALYIPLAHLFSYGIYRRVGGLDAQTAYFAAMPGGLIEAITMGEERGADPKLLSLMQFSRIIFCILAVPIGILAVDGIVVGSAAGVEMQGADAPIGPWDVLILAASGGLGVLGARWLRLPAPLIIGPIGLSAAVHLAGLTAATPPAWMISVTQLVVGVGLGLRFVGLEWRAVVRALGLSALSVGGLLCVAVGIGLALAPIVGETVEAVVLAFAPGGVVEMSLVAVSLEVSVIFVVAHHVMRIVLAVLVGAGGYGWTVGRRAE